MTTQDSINALSALISSRQYEVDALNVAMTLLQRGYTSDEQLVTQGVAATISSVISPLNVQIQTLTDHIAQEQTNIDTLTNQAVADQSTISDLQAQVLALTPPAP